MSLEICSIFYILRFVSRLASGLVEATAADVAHPLDGLVVRVVQLRLEHLQVADLEARGRERHLEAHRNGRSGPLGDLLVARHQLDLGTQL